MKRYALILVLSLAAAGVTRGQGLGAVLSSLQERQRVATGSHIEWEGIDDGDPDTVEFPSESDVQSLGIEARVRLLTQATDVFRLLYGSYVNLRPEDLAAGTDIGVAGLEPFTGVQFPPYGPIGPANYRAIFQQLALDVTRLRVLRASSGIKSEALVTNDYQSIDERWETEGEGEEAEEKRVAYDRNSEVVEDPEWLPTSFGIGAGGTSVPSYANEDSIVVTASYSEGYDEVHPAEDFPPLRGLSWDVTVKQVSSLMTEEPGYWPGGTAVMLGRVDRTPWTGEGLLDTADGAWRVVGSGAPGEAVPVDPEASLPQVSGDWTSDPPNDRKFKPDGFSFARDSGGTAVGFDWKRGEPGKVTVYRRAYACLLVPEFEKGLDAGTAKSALAKLRKVTPAAAIDGRVLPHPVPGMILGIDIGPGVEDGTSSAWLGIVPSYSATWAGENIADPVGLGGGGLPIHWEGQRFDCVPALRFFGSLADYHVAYETSRGDARKWPLPASDFDDDGFRDRGWDGRDSFFAAWDSPQIRQVVGRHMVAEVKPDNGGFSQTLKIYRRDGSPVNLAPGAAISTSGLPLLREVTLKNPSSPSGFGSGAERLSAIDKTAGTTLEVFLPSVSHYWGRWQFKLTKTTGGNELWKEVWDSDLNAETVDEINWFVTPHPKFTLIRTRDGSAQTAVVVAGLLGPCHFGPETPASMTAGGQTVTWTEDENTSGGATTVTRTTAMTGEVSLEEKWRRLEGGGRIPSSATRGDWKTEYDLPADSQVLEGKTFYKTSKTATEWIEWTDKALAGDSLKVYSAPDGSVSGKSAATVALTRYDFGGLDDAAGTLPWSLSRVDRGDGGGVLVSYSFPASGAVTTTVDSGRFAAGGSQGSIDRGGRQVMTVDKVGYPVASASSILWGGAVGTSSAAWDQSNRTAWGEPTKVTYQPGALLEQWSYTPTSGTSDNLHLRSWTGPPGLVRKFDAPDALGRVTGGEWNGTRFDLDPQPGETGADLTFGSGNDQVVTSWRSDLFGRFTSSSQRTGGRTATAGLTRAAGGGKTWDFNDGFGGTTEIDFKADGGRDSVSGTLPPFGGTNDDALSVVSGLVKTRGVVNKQGQSFLSCLTDAWGRPHSYSSPSASGTGSDEASASYTNPNDSVKRTTVTDAAGRKFVTEYDPFNSSGIIRRSGIKLSGTGALSSASDRYVESVTTVANGKLVTILKLTDEPWPGVVAGLREIVRTEWNPANGETVTKLNGSEETITRTPNWSTKTVKTKSDKDWERNETFNNLGLITRSTLGNAPGATGLPEAELTPSWRADGSLSGVSLKIGSETHAATFGNDGRLASLTVPGKGDILGGHTINGTSNSLTVDGTTVAQSRDGTEFVLAGTGAQGKTDSLSASGSGFKQTVTPTVVGAATTVNLNAAGYPDATGGGESYIWLPGGLLDKATLPRGGQVQYGYAGGAKDLASTAWPAVTSGSLSIAAIAEIYGHDRAGRINTITDAAGMRDLGYDKGRLVSTTWNSGPLRGYGSINNRDGTGRDTGFTLKRDGATVHTAQKIPIGASDQTGAWVSGNIKVLPQRDAQGRLSGYQWGSATGTFTPQVTQTWTRGARGRIESAQSNVSGAPSFDYLIDGHPDDFSFDTRDRHLKCQTSGGTWTYAYATDGHLSSATHAGGSPLGSFSYGFDGIGRRTDKGVGNTSATLPGAKLNQTVAWINSQAKTLRISADPAARVWFNGTEIPSFSGNHPVTITPPGSNGGWVAWETLAVLEGAGEGAGSPPENSLANPDAKALKKGAVWVPPVNETFTFDAAGNRESSAQWNYGWDAKNQLVRARTKDYNTAPQGWDIRFSYDSEGRRFRKEVTRYAAGAVVEQKTITYLWDGWDLIYERHQLSSGLTLLERSYLWGEGLTGGGREMNPGGLLLIREKKGNSTADLIPLYDGTGHVVALSNLAGNLLASYAYGPFGEPLRATGNRAQANPWRYATKYLDEETGLYYFGHRYYDPVTGQWLSREPLGESESLNLYSYCHNDPVNKVDRLGLEAEQVGVGLENGSPAIYFQEWAGTGVGYLLNTIAGGDDDLKTWAEFPDPQQLAIHFEQRNGAWAMRDYQSRWNDFKGAQIGAVEDKIEGVGWYLEAAPKVAVAAAVAPYAIYYLGTVEGGAILYTSGSRMAAGWMARPLVQKGVMYGGGVLTAGTFYGAATDQEFAGELVAMEQMSPLPGEGLAMGVKGIGMMSRDAAKFAFQGFDYLAFAGRVNKRLRLQLFPEPLYIVPPTTRSSSARAWPITWDGSRNRYWIEVGHAEYAQASGWYSQANILEMLAGRSPKIRAELRMLDGRIEIRDLPI